MKPYKIDFKNEIINVKDFPIKGVIFRDVSSIVRNHFKEVLDTICCNITKDIDFVAGIDSRGFIFASAIAARLDKGFIMIRKKGKLPPPVIQVKYTLEYGEDALEVKEGSGKVLLIDDVLATGGTLKASADLLKKAGYGVKDIFTVINLKYLNSFVWGSIIPKSLIEYE